MTKKILEAQKKNPSKSKKGAQKTKPIAAAPEFNRFTFNLTKGMKEEPYEEEKELLRRMRKSYRQLVEGQW